MVHKMKANGNRRESYRHNDKMKEKKRCPRGISGIECIKQIMANKI